MTDLIYNSEFYDRYSNYLREPSVRKSHDWIFDILKFNNCFSYVLDLGCGIGEFKKYFRPRAYVGIDANFGGTNVISDNYRTCNIKKAIGSFKPLAFVSLFSAEITDNQQNNFVFYERLFKELNLKAGLVSGFYYASKKNEETAKESGGLISYQTNSQAEDFNSSVFSEKRITMNVPSEMFGQDVYEVWRIFEAR